MAGSAVTKDDLKMAVAQYAEKNSLTVSENENGFALMPGDIIVSLKDGKPECGNKTAWLGICDILSESRDGPASAPQKPNLPARPMNTRSSGRYYRYAQIAFAQHVPPEPFICNIVPFAEADFATK